MRTIIMAAVAVATLGSASADAQNYYQRSFLPEARTAPAKESATTAKPTTCGAFDKDYWLMTGPYTVINQTKGISDEVAALAWCNSVKTSTMKGICIWQRNALSMMLEGSTAAYSGQPGIGLHASTCS